MRIKNRKKFIRGILIIIAFISLIACKVTYSYSEHNYKTVYVSDGDTLWSIAVMEQKSNNYYEGKDVRYIMENIKSVNNLNTSNLYEGQELKVSIK